MTAIEALEKISDYINKKRDFVYSEMGFANEHKFQMEWQALKYKSDAYPILRQFLYRDPESNINELDDMLKYFIKRIYDEVNTHNIYEDCGIISFLTFEDDGMITYSKYDVKNEKRIC